MTLIRFIIWALDLVMNLSDLVEWICACTKVLRIQTRRDFWLKVSSVNIQFNPVKIGTSPNFRYQPPGALHTCFNLQVAVKVPMHVARERFILVGVPRDKFMVNLAGWPSLARGLVVVAAVSVALLLMIVNGKEKNIDWKKMWCDNFWIELTTIPWNPKLKNIGMC